MKENHNAPIPTYPFGSLAWTSRPKGLLVNTAIRSSSLMRSKVMAGSFTRTFELLARFQKREPSDSRTLALGEVKCLYLDLAANWLLTKRNNLMQRPLIAVAMMRF